MPFASSLCSQPLSLFPLSPSLSSAPLLCVYGARRRVLVAKNPRHEPRFTQSDQPTAPIRPPHGEESSPGTPENHRRTGHAPKIAPRGEESSPRTPEAHRRTGHAPKIVPHGEESSPRAPETRHGTSRDPTIVLQGEESSPRTTKRPAKQGDDAKPAFSVSERAHRTASTPANPLRHGVNRIQRERMLTPNGLSPPPPPTPTKTGPRTHRFEAPQQRKRAKPYFSSFASWYALSVFTDQTLDLSSRPVLIFSTASIAVTME